MNWGWQTESLRRARLAWEQVVAWRVAGMAEVGPSSLARAWLYTQAIAWQGWLLLTAGLALLIEGLAAALGVLLTAADATMGWALSVLLLPVEGLFSVPYLGRGLGHVWRIALTLFWTVLGLPDALLALVGILPEKRLRLWVLLPSPAEGERDRVRQRMLDAIAVAGRILRRQANVRLIPVSPFVFDFAFSPTETRPGGWLMKRPPSGDSDGLRVGCQMQALQEDLGPLGGQIERWSFAYHLRGVYRRVFGYGAPVAAIGVDSVSEGQLAGCSLGPLVDYLTLAIRHPVCLAHEIGHACNLPHLEASGNLMKPTCGGIHLRRWQVALLRLSRHVTYL